MHGARPREHGYSLIETLVALVLITTASLLLMSVAWQMPLLMERSEAKARSQRTLEGALELVRAGVLPVQPGIVSGVPGTAGNRLRSGLDLPLVLQMQVTPTEISEVMELELRATYELRGHTSTTVLHTRVWTSSALVGLP